MRRATQARARFWSWSLEFGGDEVPSPIQAWQLDNETVRAAYEEVRRRSGDMVSFHDFVAHHHVCKAVYIQMAHIGEHENDLNKAILALDHLLADMVDVVCKGPGDQFFSRQVKERARAALSLVRCAQGAGSLTPPKSPPRHRVASHVKAVESRRP